MKSFPNMFLTRQCTVIPRTLMACPLGALWRGTARVHTAPTLRLEGSPVVPFKRNQIGVSFLVPVSDVSSMLSSLRDLLNTQPGVPYALAAADLDTDQLLLTVALTLGDKRDVKVSGRQSTAALTLITALIDTFSGYHAAFAPLTAISHTAHELAFTLAASNSLVYTGTPLDPQLQAAIPGQTELFNQSNTKTRGRRTRTKAQPRPDAPLPLAAPRTRATHPSVFAATHPSPTVYIRTAA